MAKHTRMTEGERIALRELRRHFPGFTLADLRDSGRESSHTRPPRRRGVRQPDGTRQARRSTQTRKVEVRIIWKEKP